MEMMGKSRFLEEQTNSSRCVGGETSSSRCVGGDTSSGRYLEVNEVESEMSMEKSTTKYVSFDESVLKGREDSSSPMEL